MSTKNAKSFATFGDALSYIIAKRRLTQSWVAEKSGRQRSEISRYVNNKVTPHPDTRRMLGDLLGVDFEIDNTGRYVVTGHPSADEMADHVLSATREQYASGNDRPDRDEILRMLQLAEWLIKKCRDDLSRLDS